MHVYVRINKKKEQEQQQPNKKYAHITHQKYVLISFKKFYFSNNKMINIYLIVIDSTIKMKTL